MSLANQPAWALATGLRAVGTRGGDDEPRLPCSAAGHSQQLRRRSCRRAELSALSRVGKCREQSGFGPVLILAYVILTRLEQDVTFVPSWWFSVL